MAAGHKRNWSSGTGISTDMRSANYLAFRFLGGFRPLRARVLEAAPRAWRRVARTDVALRLSALDLWVLLALGLVPTCLPFAFSH